MQDDLISRQAVLEITAEMGALETQARVKALPPVTQKPIECDDAISRQAALASIKNLYPDMPILNIMDARRKWLEKYAPYFECENAIEQLPSVTPKSKTGHWIPIYQGDEIINYHCSECDLGDTNGSTNLYGWDYCRRCGCRMVDPQESEEKE